MLDTTARHDSTRLFQLVRGVVVAERTSLFWRRHLGMLYTSHPFASCSRLARGTLVIPAALEYRTRFHLFTWCRWVVAEGKINKFQSKYKGDCFSNFVFSLFQVAMTARVRPHIYVVQRDLSILIRCSLLHKHTPYTHTHFHTHSFYSNFFVLFNNQFSPNFFLIWRRNFSRCIFLS